MYEKFDGCRILIEPYLKRRNIKAMFCISPTSFNLFYYINIMRTLFGIWAALPFFRSPERVFVQYFQIKFLGRDFEALDSFPAHQAHRPTMEVLVFEHPFLVKINFVALYCFGMYLTYPPTYLRRYF